MRRNCSRKEWMQQPDILGFAPQRLPSQGPPPCPVNRSGPSQWKGSILETFVGCPGNRLWLRLNERIWKMNLISLHTVSVIHSFYVHSLSGRESGRRWMLDLYVNFNIEAILDLKNKINASISFLMWYWKLSSLGGKITSECILPKSPIFQGRAASEEAILPFADGLCREAFRVPTVSLTVSVSRGNSEGSGASLSYSGAHLLIGWRELAGLLNCVMSFIYSHSQSHRT